jgi:SNF2 family DNA or RNA helicase
MLEKFQEAYAEMEEEGGWGNSALRQNVLVYITKMRHITGIAKIDPCVNWVADFLFETERKICIFVHHQDVHEILKRKLDDILAQGGFNPCLNFTSNLNADQREKVKKQFIENPNDRVAILSTQSSGEGLDGLQLVCADMIMLERQWNPANEEQVEGRFSRIGAKFNQVNSTYFLATGTIDEFFAELVENKRMIVKQVLTGEDLSFHEESLLRELAEAIMAKGGKKWKLKK